MFSANTAVLVVDDMASMRTLVVDFLEEMGFSDIEEAVNGREALEIIQKRYKEMKKIKLVISDWNMPEMSGLDLLKSIRGVHHLRETPFLMVTAEGEKNQVLQAVKEGVCGYVIKPVDRDGLEKKLVKVWNKHQDKKNSKESA